MKKFIPVFFAIAIVYLSGVESVQAQAFDKSATFASLKKNNALTTYVYANSLDDNVTTKTVNKNLVKSPVEAFGIEETNRKTAKANLKATKANFKASENFKEHFKSASEASWTYEKEAIVAFFVENEIQNRVVYDKRGNLIHTLTYYNFEKIPKEVRAQLKSAYPALEATLAVQIKESGLTFYIANVEDDKKIKQVVLYNGEVELLDEIMKSK